MEVNRREVPLYGLVDARVRLQTRAPVEAEFYVVVRGTRLSHVTAAKRSDDGLSLCFTVPGHDLAEVASVTPYSLAGGRVEPCDGAASLQYHRDVARETAEYLRASGDRLGPQSHRAGGGEDPPAAQSDGGGAELRRLDEKITQALANMEPPQQWKDPDAQPRADSDLHPAETLLHQPRGQGAVTSPNPEGDTPLQLAQKAGQHVMFRALAAPSGAAVAAAASCVWSDGRRVLRFCPGSDALILTERRGSGSSPQDAVMLLRDRLGDGDVLKLISELRADGNLDQSSADAAASRHGGLSKEQVEEPVLPDSVFEEQLVLSLDDDDEGARPSPPAVNGRPGRSTGLNQFNQFNQWDPHVPRFSSGTRTSRQQTDGVAVGGVTSGSSGADGGLWDAADWDDLSAADTPPPCPPPRPPSAPCSPALSPADQALSRLSFFETVRVSPPPMDACELSPGLVALELDSGDESRSPLPSVSSDAERSDDTRGTNISCSRTQSASSTQPSTKDGGEQGLRLRSYSYSSPKISLLPVRFPRDNHGSETSPDGALHSVSHGRSLLQALSLSKSLSLLHPGKQRSSSVSEPSQEKRELRFRQRAQSADDEGSVELAESLQHLTLSEFLKEIDEEQLDGCHAPTKVESEKYKVIRTFSFLKSRMSSTRNKTKGKGKDREAKEKQPNGHRFCTGPCLGPTVCVVCDRPATGKDLLHCSGCTAIVHKGCKDSVPPCLKKLQDKYAVAMVKNKTASLPQNFTVRDVAPQRASPISCSPPVPTPRDRKETLSQSSSLSGSVPNSDRSSRLSESSEAESEALKGSSQSDELLPTPTSSTSTDSCFGEDWTSVHSDMSADALDYKAESWSLAVEHKFCKKQEKQVIKRQDVIYELMQTELHHLQTLHIMAEVFRRGMREEVQLEAEAVERVFPCLDALLHLHRGFFAAMKERRQASARPHGRGNYLVRQIGDVLLQQFSEEQGEKMKQVYGEFCSRHNEAVGFFKELLQHNKKFQSFIKQQGNNSLVRRKEIPECILLVTQRITKYPVLLERILQYTQEDTEEHGNISKALAQIRDVIAAVDTRVSENEQHQKLQEVWSRLENRSLVKLKNGRTIRKQDMMGPGKMLRYQGLLLWKTATGRLKDVMALLLSDALIFLQEKDQKYTFATVDQKPPVIALQKLIVREVANEERGMFLISASAAGPEMYEVHAASKEERNTWMRLIRAAVESCPEEEEYASESEEEKRAAEARVQRLYKLQESLMSQDQQICSSLEEKLHIYAELSALSGRTDASLLDPRLLVQPDSEELPQASLLLAAALREAENLKAALSSQACLPSSSSPDSDSDSVFPSSPAPPPQALSGSPEASPEAPEASESSSTEDLVLQSQTSDVDSKVSQSVQNLTQLLYSLQAAVTLQDSCYEVQRLLLQEAGRPSPGTQQRQLVSRGSTLQEQEKQRNRAQQLQERLHQEKERWEKERQARERQQEEQEGRLVERERRCQVEAERLRQRRAELDEQLEEYQLCLERLREGQRNVEMERERLEEEQQVLQTWRHSRQRSLPPAGPPMVIPLDGQQEPGRPQPRGHAGNGSAFVNEAALVGKRNDPSAHNCLNSLLARSSSRQPVAGRTGAQLTDHNSHSYVGETWPSTAGGADPHPALPHPGDSQLDLSALVSLETESGGEETIVYL